MKPITKQCKGFPEGTCQETITDNSPPRRRLYCENCAKKKYRAKAKRIRRKNTRGSI